MFQHGTRAFPKAVKSVAFVSIDRYLTDDFGQLAGRLTTDQVHLEKSILTVREPGRKRQVLAVDRRNRRYARRVPFNRHPGMQPVNPQVPVQLRQACTHKQEQDDGENSNTRKQAQQ